MNISLSADNPFGNQEAFLVFLGDNEIAHVSFEDALGRRGIVLNNELPVGNPYEDQYWMLNHWQLHLEECSHLGIPVPDLSVADLKDEEQYTDWMRLHAQLHTLQNSALGITT